MYGVYTSLQLQNNNTLARSASAVILCHFGFAVPMRTYTNSFPALQSAPLNVFCWICIFLRHSQPFCGRWSSNYLQIDRLWNIIHYDATSPVIFFLGGKKASFGIMRIFVLNRLLWALLEIIHSVSFSAFSGRGLCWTTGLLCQSIQSLKGFTQTWRMWNSWKILFALFGQLCWLVSV